MLQESRLAMYDALSFTRTHNPGLAVTGRFDPNTDTTIVEHPSGPFFKTIGKGDTRGRVHLLPEETLYLVERGSLDLRWTGVEELEDLPLSLQAAYAYMIGSQGLSLERYTVYSGLKRSGFIVQRAPTWSPEDHDKIFVPPRGSENVKSEALDVSSQPTLISRLRSMLLPSETSTPPTPVPLVRPGFYRNYADIYRQLSLIRIHDPRTPTARERQLSSQPTSRISTSSLPPSASTPQEKRAPPPLPPTHPPLRPTFQIWKASANSTFRKSAPPPPHFHIAVLSARTDPFPTHAQLDDLLQCVPYDPPPSAKTGSHLYARIRHGYRNVVLAVVDQGVVSYVRVADAGMGIERLWEARGERGTRGKGLGARGRGRGRGRGGGVKGKE